MGFPSASVKKNVSRRSKMFYNDGMETTTTNIPHSSDSNPLVQITTTTKPSTKTSTFSVFWIENGKPHNEMFETSLVAEPLALCEELRKRAKAGEPIVHVCLSSDMIDNVGLAGVSDKLPIDYNWTKRRRAYTPGRPSGNPLD